MYECEATGPQTAESDRNPARRRAAVENRRRPIDRERLAASLRERGVRSGVGLPDPPAKIYVQLGLKAVSHPSQHEVLIASSCDPGLRRLVSEGWVEPFAHLLEQDNPWLDLE
ncbi:hypothetical protein GCM10010412_038530 [Nonomuraea recticatena]|uniref:Uncharacterized protein n=1 Tax=Nonomuraea recticatena TaxID=46178 RepID=A0ABP6EG14_9ACTN